MHNLETVTDHFATNPIRSTHLEEVAEFQTDIAEIGLNNMALFL